MFSCNLSGLAKQSLSDTLVGNRLGLRKLFLDKFLAANSGLGSGLPIMFSGAGLDGNGVSFQNGIASCNSLQADSREELNTRNLIFRDLFQAGVHPTLLKRVSSRKKFSKKEAISFDLFSRLFFRAGCVFQRSLFWREFPASGFVFRDFGSSESFRELFLVVLNRHQPSTALACLDESERVCVLTFLITLARTSIYWQAFMNRNASHHQVHNMDDAHLMILTQWAQRRLLRKVMIRWLMADE